MAWFISVKVLSNEQFFRYRLNGALLLSQLQGNKETLFWNSCFSKLPAALFWSHPNRVQLKLIGWFHTKQIQHLHGLLPTLRVFSQRVWRELGHDSYHFKLHTNTSLVILDTVTPISVQCTLTCWIGERWRCIVYNLLITHLVAPFDCSHSNML